MSTNERYKLRLVPKDDVASDPMFDPRPAPTPAQQAAALAARRVDISEEAKLADYGRRMDQERKKIRDAKRIKYPAPTSSAELASAEYPPQVYTLEKLIMAGVPQTLDGDGGIGKSNASVGAGVGVAAGKPIFGRTTIQGPVLFITHEDPLRDLQAIARGYADYLGVNLAELPIEWWSLLEHDINLATVDDKGAWKPGPFYEAFESKLIESEKGLFIVLDCRSDVVQMNEVLREPPNTFYKTILTPLCQRYGCTILVLCHPSKAAMNDGSYYSGGTGNKSALRNKLVMKLADEAPDADPLGPRVLDVLKRNRGTRDKTAVRLTFDPVREIYVADEDETVQGDKRATYELVIRAVLELIGKEGVRVVRSAKGDGRSPKDVAAYINRAAYAPDKPITRKVVAEMLALAEDNGALVYVDAYGKTKAGYKAGGVDDEA